MHWHEIFSVAVWGTVGVTTDGGLRAISVSGERFVGFVHSTPPGHVRSAPYAVRAITVQHVAHPGPPGFEPALNEQNHCAEMEPWLSEAEQKSMPQNLALITSPARGVQYADEMLSPRQLFVVRSADSLRVTKMPPAHARPCRCPLAASRCCAPQI